MIVHKHSLAGHCNCKTEPDHLGHAVSGDPLSDITHDIIVGTVSGLVVALLLTAMIGRK